MKHKEAAPAAAIDAAVENAAAVQEMAAKAPAGTGRSLRERLGRLVLEWAGPDRQVTMYTPNLPRVEDGRNWVGDAFCPAPPGIDSHSHQKVLAEWIEEERLSEALCAGDAFKCVLEAARAMSARRLIRTLIEAQAELQASGDTLYIGPASRVKASGVDLNVVKLLKPELLAAARQGVG